MSKTEKTEKTETEKTETIWLDISQPECDCGTCPTDDNHENSRAFAIVAESKMFHNDGILATRFRPDPSEPNYPEYPVITVEMSTGEDPALSARVTAAMIGQFDQFAKPSITAAIEAQLATNIEDKLPEVLERLVASVLAGDAEGLPGDTKADRKAFVSEAMEVLDELRDDFLTRDGE